VDEHLLEEMEQRVRCRPEVMKRRKRLVEHPFGTMTRWWDAGYFLMRGLEKVRAEFSLTVLAYNLRRGLNIVGMPGLMATLNGVRRVVGRAVLAEVQEALLLDRWSERHTTTRLCGSQCGWAA
jgi:hypothetical protein